MRMGDTMRYEIYSQLRIMLYLVKKIANIIEEIPEINDQEPLEILEKQIIKTEHNLNNESYYRCRDSIKIIDDHSFTN
jgi:hypothetical protein